MMKTTTLRVGLTLLLSSTACDSKEQCVADCGSSLSEEATEFIENNRACETALDCVAARIFCYDGPVSNPCGTVGLASGADDDTWQTISSELATTCDDPVPVCGAGVQCNAAQQCESFFGSDEHCPNIARDVETFLAANRACETADDCVFMASDCYVDECSGVAVNRDANGDDWEFLDQLLWECDSDHTAGLCNFVGECGFDIGCVQGQCSALF